MSACTPSVEEWEEDLAMPSGKGGMSARPTDEGSCIARASLHDSAEPVSVAAADPAAGDLDRIAE
eukprot:3073176-Pyramimonas_sp.AAC.1